MALQLKLHELLKNNTFFAILFTTLVYFVFAKFGDFFSTLNNITTPIWPATGAVLGLALLMGYRIWPGILLGNLLGNYFPLSFLLSDQPFDYATFINTNITQNLSFALGALVQTFFAVWLIRKLGCFPQNFTNPKHTLKFYLVAGPIPSVIGCTIGMADSFINQVKPFNTLAFEWMSWWLADMASILIFTTLLIAIALFDNRRKIQVLVSLSVIFSVTVIIYSLSLDWEKKRMNMLFEQRALGLASLITQSAESYRTLLLDLNGFLLTQGTVTKDDFKNYADNILLNHPSITTVNWNEYVADNQKPSFENKLSEIHNEKIMLWETGPDNKRIAARQRNDSFIIKYIEPYSEFVEALGFDTMSTAERREAAAFAIKNNAISVTAPIVLPEQPENTSIAMYYPHKVGDNVVGFSAIVVKLADMLFNILRSDKAKDFELKIRDITAKPSAQLLYQSEGIRENVEGSYQTAFSVFNRVWLVEFQRSEAFNFQNGSFQPTLIGMVGMVLASIFVVVLIIITGQRLYLEETVRIRTEALEKANKVKSEFMANMSHDLRTPLNAILGFSDIMRQEMFGKLGNPKYNDYADDINSSSLYLLSIINDILDFSTLEAGQRHLIKKQLDTEDLINECLRNLRSLSDQKEIKCTVFIANGAERVFADYKGLKQILINIIANAIKYTRNGGNIFINVEAIDKYINLSVVDTGIGIKEEDIDHVLDPFTCVQENAYVPHEGTGLGLAIVNALVKLHDGKISIQSSVNIGTTVTVELPKSEFSRDFKRA